MPLTISHILDADALETAHEQISGLEWKDGAETAGSAAREVKRNLQADLASRTGVSLRDTLQDSLSGHPVFEAYARPVKWSRLLISKTGEGGGYGFHIDNSFMGVGSQRLRTDLSFTLFLNDPSDYDGGELVIEEAGVIHRVKGVAGDVVIYPSNTLHCVDTVTRGERLVCVGWVESIVRDGDQRNILFDLTNLKAELLKTKGYNAPEVLILAKTIANLTRMWAG